MMKRLLTLAVAASLSACATIGAADRLAAAAPTIERIQTSYDAAKRLVALFLPYLPADRRAQIEEIGGLVDRALYAARTASTVAAQRAAIEQAREATAQFLITSGN